MEAVTLSKARALGLARFFTGLPCKRGHISERKVVNSTCMECHRGAMAEARKDNIKKFRIRDCLYASAHREQARLRSKKWAESHPDRKRTADRLHYQHNSARVRSNVKAWRDRNKERHNTSNRNRRASAAAGGRHTYRDINRLWVEQRGICAYCPSVLTLKGYHVDHVIPLSRGGSNDGSNLCLSCPSCNLRKHTMTGEEYRAHLAALSLVGARD